jgi:hypothetical protein
MYTPGQKKIQPYLQRLRLRAAFFWSQNLTPVTLNSSLGIRIGFQIQEIENTQKHTSVIFNFEVARPAPNNSRSKNGARATQAAAASGPWPPLSWPSRPWSGVYRLQMDLYTGLYRRVAEVAFQILQDFCQPTSATFASMAV